MRDRACDQRRVFLVMSAVVLALLNSACTELSSGNSAKMLLGAAVLAPQGFLEFCERWPDQCGFSALSALADDNNVRRALERQEWRSVFTSYPVAAISRESVHSDQAAGINDGSSNRPLLDEVNDQINAAIVPLTNERSVSWSLPPNATVRLKGDCKLYVLEKRRLLIARGFPPSALSIAIVRTPRNETHAVLLAATAEGEVVLDNLTKWIVSWPDAHYRWIERQVPGEPLRWVTIDPAAAA